MPFPMRKDHTKLYIPTCSRNQKSSCLFTNSSLFLGSIDLKLSLLLSFPSLRIRAFMTTSPFCHFSHPLSSSLSPSNNDILLPIFGFHMYLLCRPAFGGEASNAASPLWFHKGHLLLKAVLKHSRVHLRQPLSMLVSTHHSSAN